MKKERVLIVDDSRMNRMMLSELLMKYYDVTEVCNGRQAIDLLAQDTDFSLMILDINMPEMDGFAVLKKMKEMRLIGRIPVIVNTQYDEEENELRAFELGATDFITKPYNPSIILYRIRNVIEKSYYEIDQLTGIFSREAFYLSVRRLMEETDKDYVIVYWNIERFKLINDIYGNSVGNKILKAMADMISQEREGLATCGRIYGDHFASCYEKDAFRPQQLAEEARAFFGKLIQDYNVSYAMGIYEVTDRELPVEQMCDRATVAMRTVEEVYGVDYAYYNEQMRENLMSIQEIASYAEIAMQENQFYIRIQPIYNSATNRPIAGEVLVRWNHPKRGEISPGIFIPMFEQNGYIRTLDAFVREEACRFLRKVIDEGKRILPISINLSRIELLNPDIVEELEDVVQRYNIDKAYIHFEVTESAYAKNPKQVIEAVNQIRSRGFIVLMDDFGSGYSSLNMLKDVEVDVLKIDMGFVKELETSKRG